MWRFESDTEAKAFVEDWIAAGCLGHIAHNPTKVIPASAAMEIHNFLDARNDVDFFIRNMGFISGDISD